MNKILLVDDDHFTRMMVEDAISNDYDVVSVASGAEAFAVLEKDGKYDLLMLDVIMPDLDGYQVLERLRADERFASMPVIFLTGRDSPADIVRGLNAGASDYLVKPFSMQELRARIHTQFRLKVLSDALVDVEKVKAVKGLLVTLKHEIINSLSNISACNNLLELGKGGGETNHKIEVNVKRIKDLLDSIEALKEIDLVQYTSSIPKPMLKI